MKPTNANEPSRTDPQEPIGVFDSGVGGMSVLKNLRGLLPTTDFIYVADQAYAPYGDRSVEEIQERSLKITNFLLAQRCRLLVIACNTATVAALPFLQQKTSIPIIGIEPAVKAAALSSRTGVIGVIATTRTINGSNFDQFTNASGSAVKVLKQPCPGLADCVDNAELDDPQTRELVTRYVNPLINNHVDSIVIGCTHYSFLKDLILECAGKGVHLYDAASSVARHVAHISSVQTRGRLATDQPGTVSWHTTGNEHHASAMQALWGEDISVSRIDLQ